MRVRWARAASRHLDEIGDFIARDDLAAADRTVVAIMNQVEELADHAHIGRVGRVEGTRELVIAGTQFIAVYRVAGREIEIVAVFHGARRWPDKFA